MKILRPVNLSIVALTMYALRSVLWRDAVALYLSDLEFALLVVSTVLVAAGGYIINDIYDVEIDQLNKPEKTYIGTVISLKQAWGLYTLITLLGAGLSLFLAIEKGQNWNLLGFYPLSVALLWLYSYHFKRTFLWGNLIVALFCAAVPVMITIGQAPSQHTQWIYIYAVFAFISTLLRELVKDMEDVEGDARNGCRTLPIVWGLAKARWVWLSLALPFFVFLLASAIIYVYLSCGQAGQAWYYLPMAILVLGLILVSSVACTRAMWQAQEKSAYTKTSSWLKLLMLAGLLAVFIL